MILIYDCYKELLQCNGMVPISPMSSIKSEYKQLIKSAQLKPDAAQKSGIDALMQLQRQLHMARGIRLLLGLTKRPTGLYLFGPPGRGKSMMMDLFFRHVDIAKKRRVHFHAFMVEIHGLIKKWRDGNKSDRLKTFGFHKGDDPIAAAAKYIAKRTELLCFDEFQVSDIADAMVLGRLTEALLANRVTFVFTSNRAPDDLYKNGLNRDRFEPFIEMIKARFKTIEVAGPKDFRMERLKGAATYFWPLSDPNARQGFERLWADMSHLNEPREVQLVVNERTLTLPRAAGPFLRTRFDELCATNTGAADYLAIAERFTTVFIEDVPIMGPENRNEAKRFVNLVDALYEASCLVIILAAAEPRNLYVAGDGAFEFERTVSRLEEMRSEDYINRQR